MTHAEMVEYLRGFVGAEYVDWEPEDNEIMAEVADEFERLAQEQDVRAFEEVQNIGRELLATMKERDFFRGTLGYVVDWTHRHGAALCPPPGRADTYGEGMRDAKQQVLDLLCARDKEKKP